jgi:hypothetical protein
LKKIYHGTTGIIRESKKPPRSTNSSLVAGSLVDPFRPRLGGSCRLAKNEFGRVNPGLSVVIF